MSELGFQAFMSWNNINRYGINFPLGTPIAWFDSFHPKLFLIVALCKLEFDRDLDKTDRVVYYFLMHNAESVLHIFANFYWEKMKHNIVKLRAYKR